MPRDIFPRRDGVKATVDKWNLLPVLSNTISAYNEQVKHLTEAPESGNELAKVKFALK